MGKQCVVCGLKMHLDPGDVCVACRERGGELRRNELPESINIGGLLYEVTLEDNLSRDERASGRSCGNALQIRIDSSLPPQQKRSTLLHEIIEQIDYRYCLGLSEQQITILEAALFPIWIMGIPEGGG